MSVKDFNKIINISSGLTGCLYFSIDYDDYINNIHGADFFYSKINELISNDEDVIIKIGYKS